MRLLHAKQPCLRTFIRNRQVSLHAIDPHNVGIGIAWFSLLHCGKLGLRSVITRMARDEHVCACLGREVTKTLGRRTVRPVSYTHLRAHETPEHLVCRLL